jgi:hypothetical protein
VRGVQPVPHANDVPSPPHTFDAGHDPQSTESPQPSPIGPHVAPADAHVTRPQPIRASGFWVDTGG